MAIGTIEAVSFENMSEAGTKVLLRVEINSWVSLRPGKMGGHAKDAVKHGGSNSIEGSYKAKILQFRMSPGCKAVSAIRVQHAYMQRQLDLDPAVETHQGASNYLYLSKFRDWVHPDSIIGVIVVLHAGIGERTRGPRSHAKLLRSSIFFYNASYVLRSETTSFGHLVPIPLPGLDSAEWPLPDMFTTEAFRARFRIDIQSAMRPTTGSKQTHLSWFLPIHVFVDLFVVASGEMQRTPIMFVFRQPMRQELTDSLMDRGWSTKISIADDHIKCIVDCASIIFRYHIGRSILYMNFVYNRERQIGVNRWEAMDHLESEVIVPIQCEMENTWSQELEVGMTWSLLDVRKELEVFFGSEVQYRMWIVGTNRSTRVNDRNKRKILVADLLPPRKICLIERA